MSNEPLVERVADFLNAFKADPFSTGADKAERLISLVSPDERLIEALERIQDEARTVGGDWRETASMIDSICIAALRERQTNDR